MYNVFRVEIRRHLAEGRRTTLSVSTWPQDYSHLDTKKSLSQNTIAGRTYERSKPVTFQSSFWEIKREKPNFLMLERVDYLALRSKNLQSVFTSIKQQRNDWIMKNERRKIENDRFCQSFPSLCELSSNSCSPARWAPTSIHKDFSQVDSLNFFL